MAKIGIDTFAFANKQLNKSQTQDDYKKFIELPVSVSFFLKQSQFLKYALKIQKSVLEPDRWQK